MEVTGDLIEIFFVFGYVQTMLIFGLCCEQQRSLWGGG